MMSWLFALLPFILPAYVVRLHVGPLPTTALELYVVVLLAVFFYQNGWRGFVSGWKRLGKWRGPMIAWAVATVIAVVVAPGLWSALGLWRAYVLEPLLVMVMLAETVRSEADADRVRQSLYWTVLLLAGWALVQFVTGSFIPSPWNVSIAAGRRATGPFPFPNALSLFVTPIGAWAFCWWLKGFPFSAASFRLEFWAWVSALAAILFARSDGGLIAFLTIAWLALLLDRRLRRLAIGIVVAFALVLLVPSVRLKVWNVVSFHEWSGQVRLTIWRESIAMLKDHPFFGAGFGGYPTAILPYHKATYLEVFQFPHNILLNLWSETGVLGMLAFLWIVVTWIRQRKDLLSLAPLLAILIHGLVDVPYFKNDLAVLFWVLALLTTVPLDREAVER